MTKAFAFILVFLLSELCAMKVDILSDFNIDELPPALSEVRQECQVRCFHPAQYVNQCDLNDPDVKKIVLFNPYISWQDLCRLPKEKLVLFLWEPEFPNNAFYERFSAIYTWNDQLIDGIKFFRFNYPYLMQMQGDVPKFEDKKFCALITSRYFPHRLAMVQFFANKHQGDLDIYGWTPPPGYSTSAMYKGVIPGQHSGLEKISLLKQYRFSLCFENTPHAQGYITEKIFGSFAAGCVPVYYGPLNIADYIPKNCFIDYRDFSDNEELYQYLKSMSEEEYEHYLRNIETYLSSEKAKLFGPAHFDQIFYEATCQN